MRTLPRSLKHLTSLIFLCLGSTAASLHAATYTWTPTAGGTFQWNSGPNWGGTAPVPGAPADVVNLTANLAGAQTINLDASATLGVLNIGDPTTGFFAYTLVPQGGSTLTFDNLSAAAAINKANIGATLTDVIAANINLASSLNSTFNITNASANTTNVLQISGNISETNGSKNIVVSGATGSNGVVVLSGNNSFTGSVSLATGTLRILGAQALNTGTVNTINLSGGTLDLRADGNGTDGGPDFVTGTTVRTQKIVFGDNVAITGSTTINVDRVGGYTAGTASAGGTLFQTPLNKTMQLGTLSIGANTLTIANNTNGYGVEFSGAVTLTGAATFSVTPASGSTTVPGLVLSGIIDDGAGSFGFTKAGAGTLLLTNAANSFTGTMLVTGGVLGATSNGALGDTANVVTIGSGAASTFQAFDTFTATGRVFNFANGTNTSNIIGVSQDKTLTVDTAFAGAAANGFQKSDAGTLVITVNNATKTGATTVAGGVLQLNVNDGTGSGAITVATGIGNALHLSGGITEASAITLSGGSGVNSSGALFSVAGSNTVGSPVALGAATSIGAASTATLNMGNITGAFALTVAGEGTVNLNGTVANNLALLRSTNTTGPTAVIGVASAIAAAQTVTLNGGTLVIGNTAGVGSLAAGAGAVVVNAGSTLRINDAGGTAVLNRLGIRALTLQGSNLEYIGNGLAASSETIGAFTLGLGQSNISVTGGTAGNAATLVFGTGSLAPVAGSFVNFTTSTDNIISFTTAPTGVGGVVQRASLNGTDLVAATAGTVTAATYTGVADDINNNASATTPGGTTAATANAQITGAGPHYLAGPATTLNSLVMNSGVATTITSNSVTGTLTITSGNILVSGSTGNVLSGMTLAQGSVPTAFMVNTGSSLQFGGVITTVGNVGLQKANGGLLEITTRQFFNSGTAYFDINAGTVKLSGGNHTLAAQLVNVALAPGATLDLNGTVLETNRLDSTNVTAGTGTGGDIINSSATQATLVNRGASTFGGRVMGNIAVGHGQTTVLYNDNSYTGDTFITGGTTTLQDMGKLSATNAIFINGGGLTITNGGTLNDNNRVNDLADITVRTGTIIFTGRDNTASSEVLGDVILAEGASQMTVNNGGAGTRSTDLILTSLTRSSNDAAINVNTANAEIGSNPRVLVTGGLTLTNNIIGGWAVTGGTDFISYNDAFGIANLNSAGMAGYDRTLSGNQTFTNLAATENIKNTGTFASTLGDALSNVITVNTIVLNPGAASSLAFADSNDVLNLTGGGMIRNGAFAVTIGSAVDNGRITSGGVGAVGTQTLHFHNTQAATTTVNSRFVDNGAAALRVVFDMYLGSTVLLANGNNSYTGGTVVNGWAGSTGNSNAGTLTAGAVGAISGTELIINNALVTSSVVGGIAATNNVTLNMGAGLTLANGTNTLASLTINATGFSGGANGAPTVTIGNGTSVLILTNPTINASSNNATGVGTGVITASAAGAQLNFDGDTAVFNIDGIKLNGQIIDPWTATLNVGANVNIVNANGLLKQGDGILQLSSTGSTFSGGVNLTAGGLMIGASSSAAVPNTQVPVLAGPLGTGTLTIGNNTRILSSASANAVTNQVVVNGDFQFDGLFNVALNGFTDLGGVVRTISVNALQMSATMGGVISNGGIIKTGNGTLILGNANTFAGGVTLNSGTLAGLIPIGASANSPFGTGAVTYNGGLLSFRGAIDAYAGNDINVNSALPYVNLEVISTTSANSFRMGNLNLPMSTNPTVRQVNVSGGTAGNPSTLVLTANSLTSNSVGASGSRVAGQYQVFNIGANTTLAITNGGFARNNEPLNIGTGTLLLGGNNLFSNGTTVTTSNTGAAPAANTVSAVYGTGQTVTLSGTGIVYTIAPQMGASLIGGSPTGGLQQSYTVVGVGNLNVPGNWGTGPTSVMNGVLANEAAANQAGHAATANGLVVHNGYINITTAGTYSFIVGSDDNSSLVIDGMEIARDIGGGHGVQDTARGSIFLTAGQHAITVKANTGSGAGGVRLLYSGPDTAASGGNNGYQALPSSALSYFTGPANAGNNFYNAAQIDNDYAMAANTTATLQGLGTDFNSTLKTLTMGNTSILTVTNDLGAAGVGGTGFIGIKGVTTLGTSTTVNPTTGILYLIGGINDGGNGLTKTGAGSLWLNNSTLFTGAFAINTGTVRLFESDALSTGSNTVGLGASIDLNGVGSSAGRNVTINGAGTATSQNGAIYNSSALAATLAGNLTLATASQISGYGDITVSGTVTSTVILTKAGVNTLTLTGSNAASFTGGLTIAAGVVNNGTLNSGGVGATGSGSIIINSGAVLNLNGNNVAQGITVNGTSIANMGPNNNTLGNIINTSISTSATTAAPAAAGSAQLKQANTANTATISGPIALNTATTGIGSNTYATGGDIIITGNVSGGQALTKVGGDTVYLRGAANSYSGGTNVNYGSLVLDNGGILTGAGGAIDVRTGASFTLDNTGTFTNNRINNNVAANNKNMLLKGGTFNIFGNSSAANDVAESLNASLSTDTRGISLDQGHNNINLIVASPTGGSITLTLTRSGTGLDIGGSNAATALITGRRLGLDVAGTDGSTNLVLTNSATTNGGLHIIGQQSNTASGGTNGSTSKGVSPFIIVDDLVNGANFAVVSSTAGIGIRGLGTVAGEYVAGNTNTLAANLNTLINASTTTAANATISINSLKITGSTLTLQQGTTMNIQSGGILATADATIAGPGIISVDGTPVGSANAAAQNLYIHTIGATTDLTLNASIGFALNNSGRLNEVVKAGTGSLILGGTNFYTTNTRINEGTLVLNNAQAIFYRQTTAATPNNLNGSNAGQTLQINGGGTLEMNGFHLTVNNFNSINPASNQGSLSGGTVINSVLGTRDFTMNATTNNTWSGNISSGTGVINFSRYGRDTFTISNENTYTGTTVIGGGATTMVDVGALRGTSLVRINAATLIWNDNGTQGDAWRLGATPADIIMNGGGFQYNGRQATFSVANLGDVTLASGTSQFTVNAATLGNATIQMASLTRNTGTVVHFAGSVLGDDGFIRVASGLTNYNGILGGWAITNTGNPYATTGQTSTSTGDFVQYDAATGIRAIVDYRTTATIDYSGSGLDRPGYGNAAFGAGFNVKVNGNTTLAAGTNVANSVVLGTTATTTLTFAGASDTLYLQSGGFLGDASNNAKNLGATAGVGRITAGNSDGTAGAGNPNYELFIHNLANTLTVNTQIVDNGANAVSLVTSTGAQNGPVIRLAASNTYTGTTTINSADVRLASTTGQTLANSTSIFIVGGTENAADSSRQAMSRLFFENAGNQVNSGATINIVNNATFDTNNFDQTLANITFTNTGGHTGNSSGIGGSVRSGNGIITLTGSITATNLTNISVIPFISGNLDLGGGQRTVTVDAITGAGPQGAAQIGLSILAGMSDGGINKEGSGVLAITGVNSYSGNTNINNGTLVLGGRDQQATPAAITTQLANSRVNLASGTVLDFRGGNALIGSLSGSGLVTNSVYATTVVATGAPATLTLGLDNTSDADFSGRFTNFINGINETTGYTLNVTKLGTGTQIISGDNAAPIASATANGDVNNVGTLDIQQGTILVNGANGSLGFTTINIKQGAALTLDYRTDNKANRLGGFRLSDSANGDTANDTTTARTINMQGGTLTFMEGASLINEGLAATLAMGTNNGAPTVVLNSGSSIWTFNTTGGSGGATVNVAAMTAGAGSLFIDVGGTQTLGRVAAGANSVNVYVNGGKTGQGAGVLSAPGTAVAAAAGVQGNVVGGIRADITAQDSTGFGFVTYDTFGYRLLESDEYSAFPVQPDSPLTTGTATTPTNPPANWAAVNPTISATYTGNAIVITSQNFTTNTTISSLRMDSGGGITSIGGSPAGGSLPLSNFPVQNYNALGTLNTLTISSGSIIANTGSLGFTGGAISAAGATLRITAAGNITSGSFLISTAVGTALVKNGAGTLDLTKRVFLGSSTDAGNTTVNGGTLLLNAGANTLTVLNTAGASAVDNLVINPGAVVDMMGSDQVVASLTSADPTPGGGGTITNTGAMANLFTNANAGFGGTITGAINLYKTGTGNLTLSSPSDYTGVTNIQAGILILQDGATLTSTTYNLFGGQLRYENRATSLQGIANRVPSNSTFNMRSGTFMTFGRPSQNIVDNVATVNILEGYNEIRVDAAGGAYAALNIDTLNLTTGSQVHFNTGFGVLGASGLNPSIYFDVAPTTIGGVIPWAVASTDQIAMYNSTINPLTGGHYGVAVPNVTGGAFTTPNYQDTTITGAATGENVNQSTGVITELAATTARIFNSFRFSSTTGTTVTLAPAELVRLEAGVFIAGNTATLNFNGGRITAGTTADTAAILYMTQANSNTTSMTSQIVDNGTGAVTLVKGGSAQLTLNPTLATAFATTGAATNATVAGSTTVTIAAAPTTPVAPGDAVTGPGIPNGAVVTAVLSPTSFTISAPALATTNGTTIGFGTAQVITGTNATVASGSPLPTINVTNAQAASLFAGTGVSGVGVPAGITIATIGAPDSGGAGFTTITLSAGSANATIAANQAFAFASGQVITGEAYTGPTIINQGTVAFTPAAGTGVRLVNSSAAFPNPSVTINNGGTLTLTPGGAIAPTADVIINGGGILNFGVSANATSGLNALNSLTFNNNGGSVTPTVDIRASGILTIKNGLVTSTSDNQGFSPIIQNGTLTFGQISLGTSVSGSADVTVTDVGGFVVGQTVVGVNIPTGTTISAINGNVLTLSAPVVTGTTGAVSTLNQAAGSTAAIAPTLNVMTSTVNKLSADLVISSVIANSTVGGAGIGGWSNLANGGAALTKTGNGNLVLSGVNTFDNGFNLNQGTVTVGNAAAFGTGTLSIAGGTTILAGGTAQTITNAININGNFTFGGQQAGHNITQTTGAVNLGGATRTITVTNPLVTATITGAISNGGLAKSGNGTLLLNGTNTYTGGTTVNAGLLTAGSATALGAGDLTVKAGGTLNINGFAQTVDGLNGDNATMGGLITNAGGTAVDFTIGSGNEATAVFAGTITNAANALRLVKTGTGTQILNGTNTYTGTTTVSAGVLQVGDNVTRTNATLGSGAVFVNNTGTLAGTGHVLAPTAGTTMTIATGGVLAPGVADVTPGGGINGNLTLGSTVGNGLRPLPVNGAAGTSPSTVSGAVNLTVSDGGQIQMGVTSATLNDASVLTAVSGGTYTTAAAHYAALSTTEKQKWNGQGWTQAGTALVGSNTVTLANLGLGVTGGTGNGGIYVGQTVTGAGIDPGTTVVSINSATGVVTLSSNITATGDAISFGSSVQNVTVVAGSTSITVANTAGLSVGNTVSGVGIATGTTISNITGNVITLNQAALGSSYSPTLTFAQPGNHDHLTISGTLSLGTNANGTVRVIDNGYLANAATGDVFNLLDWSTMTISGTFNVGTNFRDGSAGSEVGMDLELPDLSSKGLLWDVSAFASHGILVVVPEPSRALLFVFALSLITLRRRRKM